MITTSTKLVAFIDILGFSKIIESYDSGKNLDVLHKLKSSMDSAVRLVKGGLSQGEGDIFFDWKESMDSRLFSDCLAVATPLRFKSYGFIDQFKFFYKYLMAYQIVLMEDGFFTRGAVAIGSHYADDNMIFSGGLVEAYNLEHKLAIQPRIILSEKVIEEIQKFKTTHSDDLNYMLVKDEDGLCFLNHFNYNLMDSRIMDQSSSDFLERFGTMGLMDESFEEKDLKAKRTELLKIKALSLREKEQADSDSIRDKHVWLIDFIDFELGNGNKRNFRSFNSWS
jgi:hypothetical protein